MKEYYKVQIKSKMNTKLKMHWAYNTFWVVFNLLFSPTIINKIGFIAFLVGSISVLVIGNMYINGGEYNDVC